MSELPAKTGKVPSMQALIAAEEVLEGRSKEVEAGDEHRPRLRSLLT